MRQARLRVVKPRLPRFSAIAPYLARIDENRYYSNHGPLLKELEMRLAQQFCLRDQTVAACANGTLALWAAIAAARQLRPRAGRKLCLLPAFTYVATLSAVQMAGLTPWLCDVDGSSWALDPWALRQHPQLDEVAVVVPVAPFGRRPDLRAWAEFSGETGIAVAIDAAACFEWLAAGPCEVPPEVPIALSLHATKSFGCGEGGLIVATDPEMMVIAHAMLNFGFSGQRRAQWVGTNGKMSEYIAAVALAELDGWPEKSAIWAEVADTWRAMLPGLFTAPETASCYALLDAGRPERTQELCQLLAAAEVDTLIWYGSGLAGHPAHAALAQDALPVTTDLGARLIGLPSHIDLSPEDMARVTRSIALAGFGGG